MERTLSAALHRRRSYYALTAKSPAADSKLEEIIRLAILHTPSAFNAQSTHLVLLLGQHQQLIAQMPFGLPSEAFLAGGFARIEARIRIFR